MSILILEYAEGKFKVAFELASYIKSSKTLEQQLQRYTKCKMFLNYKYSVDKVLKVNNDKLSGFTAAYADVIKQAAEQEG
jgi:electron transfer flavoprotein alpha subunit